MKFFTGLFATLNPNNVMFNQTAKSYARDAGILFFETSARTGQNVKEVFLEIAKRLPTKKASEKGVALNDAPPPNSTPACCGGG